MHALSAKLGDKDDDGPSHQNTAIKLNKEVSVRDFGATRPAGGEDDDGAALYFQNCLFPSFNKSSVGVQTPPVPLRKNDGTGQGSRNRICCWLSAFVRVKCK